MINISQWEMVNGISTEVGLSPGQTEGYVGETYVSRTGDSDTSLTYYTPESGRQSPEEKMFFRFQRPESFSNYHSQLKAEARANQGKSYLYVTPEQEQRINKIQQAQFNAQEQGKATLANFKSFQINSLLQHGYKPTTVEGTTVYSKPGVQEVYVPRFGKMIPEEEYWKKHPTPFMKAGAKVEEWNKQISEKYSLPEKFDEYIKSYSAKTERYRQSTKEAYKGKTDYTFPKKEGGELESFVYGAGHKAASEPLTAAGNLAFALLVTKGIGILPKLPGVTAGIGGGAVASRVSAVNILGAGLAGMYGIDVAGRYAEAPNKARFLGELTFTELVPFAVGGYLGGKPLPKTSSIISKTRNLLESFKTDIGKRVTIKPEPDIKWSELRLIGEGIEGAPFGKLQRLKTAKDLIKEWDLDLTPAQHAELMRRNSKLLLQGELKESGAKVLALLRPQQPKPKIKYTIKSEPLEPTGISNPLKFVSTVERMQQGLGGGLSGQPTNPYARIINEMYGVQPQPRAIQPTTKVSFKNYKPSESIKAINAAEASIRRTEKDLRKLWGERERAYHAAPSTGTKQKTIQITKQEVKTAQAVKEKVETVQATREKVKVIDKPRIGSYSIAYVSAATRMMDKLIGDSQASSVMSMEKEKVRTGIRPQLFVSEATKVREKIGEQVRTVFGEKEKVKVMEKTRTLEKQATRQRTKQTTKQIAEPRTKKILILKPREFTDEIDSLSKRKKKGKYVWDIRNPIPTFSSTVFGK